MFSRALNKLGINENNYRSDNDSTCCRASRLPINRRSLLFLLRFDACIEVADVFGSLEWNNDIRGCLSWCFWRPSHVWYIYLHVVDCYLYLVDEMFLKAMIVWSLPLIMVQWKIWKMGSWKMFFFAKTGQTSTSSDWKGKKSRQSPNVRDDPYYFLGEEEWHWALPLKFPIMSTNLELVSQSGGVYLLGNGRTLKPQPNFKHSKCWNFTLIKTK